MEITTEREGGTLIVEAGARVDGSNARDFQDALRNAIEDSDSAVILDFQQLTYISSAGLRVLLLIAKELQRRNAKLAVCSLVGPVREVFEISGFNKIIPIHDSRADATVAVKS